ncbi:histidinol dehydrogenase [Flavobacterium sp.]|uniref:histidinol dehydrogenase n=1 Tax=Flavobacterium sp. TaxID=239 RepID=UPI0011F95ECB|nr:histidinol dehydrogenase [Flavobacterium sp.]RZJ69511.1 MAG: histidinol dehydrogenase [Flavobacterium sp.]
MKTTKYPEKRDWAALCERPKLAKADLDSLVAQIFEDVARNGDDAVLKYSSLFDGSNSDLEISMEKVAESGDFLSDELKAALKLAKSNITKFHASQKESVQVLETVAGVQCWRENRAIGRIGIYIPGGSAPLFSTVLMLAIPAKLAGCKEIVLCSPPNKNGEIAPEILYAAKVTGVTKVFAVGGIQAIAALSVGTKAIEKVDKIFGPGNQYVTAAKQFAFLNGTAIDLPAGPSEVLVIADATSNPEFVAADLLSQAEHGSDSQVILLSDDMSVLERTMAEIDKQLEVLPRLEIARSALENSRAILLESLDECIDFSNFYAPEHLIIASENADAYVEKIECAGSVFLGNLSCESAGDYASGTNHTLPTNGYAKSYSGVSRDSFVKKITFQKISETGLRNIGRAIEIMAEAEQLLAHKNAVSIRLKTLENV